MAAAGDIGGGGVRRPSAAGSNTQVLFNQGGVEGASPNLTFDGKNLVFASTNTTTYANGTIVVASANNNFNNTATINVSGTANGTQSNIAFSANANAIIASANQSNVSTVVKSNGQIQIDYILGQPGGGGGTPTGPNLAIQFDNNGAFGGNANALYNAAAQNVAFEANIQLANATALTFGGNQANGANTLFVMSYNASSNSVDIVFV